MIYGLFLKEHQRPSSKLLSNYTQELNDQERSILFCLSESKGIASNSLSGRVVCNYFQLISTIDQNVGLETYSAMEDITEETAN